MTGVLPNIGALERALIAAGFPPMSQWWRDTVVRFYESGRRQLVIRAGRRAGKSSSLCRVAVAEGLFGEHTIPPGDVGVVAFISVSRDEANQRLRTVRAILDALRVPHRPIEHGIELTSRPIAFKTYVATVAGVSGFTCVAAVADEASKWRDSDSGANPASEVLGSLRPTMATQASAKMFLSSSPLGPDDAHATAFDAGDTDFQITAYAPTWVANPTVTEAATHKLEPDIRRWRREYLAEPQASALAAFDVDAIDRAMGTEVSASYSQCERVVLVDPTAGASDTFAYCTAGWRKHDGRAVLEIRDVSGIAEAAKEGVTSDKMVRDIATLARRSEATVIHSDQFEKFSLASAFTRAGFTFVPHTWTAQAKERCVEHVRMWLRDGLLALPRHERLRRELLAFEERISPSGALTFRGRQGGHDDFAMLILLAALVDIEGGLAGTPSGQQMKGAGLFEFFERTYGHPPGYRPPVQPVPEPAECVEAISMHADRILGASVFSDNRGRFWPVVDGTIRVPQSFVEEFQKMGFYLT
jgi:hypothetical protein